MYEFSILNLLLRGPAHGYLIAKIMSDMFGPHARASNGRLYPLLAKLEQTGLITVVDGADAEDNARQLRRFQITDKGRRRFQELMMDTTSGPSDYRQLFAHKVTAFDFIEQAERRHLIDHYITFCQQSVVHLRGQISDLKARRGGFDSFEAKFDYLLEVLERLVEDWESETRWVKKLRTRTEG